MYYTHQYTEFFEKTGWDRFIKEEQAQKDFGFCGYYKKHMPKLNMDILALNTNLYYRTKNTELDPCGQFTWLSSQLQDAEKYKRKVLITGHVPPGFYERTNIGPFFDQIDHTQPEHQGDMKNQYYADVSNNRHKNVSENLSES